jgi:hypothetical protein
MKSGIAHAMPAFCCGARSYCAGIGSVWKMLKAWLIDEAIYLAFFSLMAVIFPYLSPIYSLFYGRKHPNGMILLRCTAVCVAAQIAAVKIKWLYIEQEK